MDTSFAPAERATTSELAESIRIVSTSPVIDAILGSVGGLIAVLDEHRQILAVNDALLRSLGLRDGRKLLGLRPGEAVGCVHADDNRPGGCGTARVCATCGAAIAIVSVLEDDRPNEQECALEARRNGDVEERVLSVQCSPLHVAEKRFLLLLLRDITVQRRRAELESIFFHDINNIVGGIHHAASLMADSRFSERHPEMAPRLRGMADRLLREIRVQRALASDRPEAFRIEPEIISPRDLLAELVLLCEAHPIAHGKKIEIVAEPGECALVSDHVLLSRVLGNLLKNALEASEPGDSVRIGWEALGDKVEFTVWNAQAISDAVAPRVFQRFFSTKPGSGRGLGGFAVKLLGERYLKGRVTFTTSPVEGTTFRLRLPLRPS